MSSIINRGGGPANLDKLAREGDTHAAATQLEAYFLRQVLAEVRKSSEGGMLDGGFAGSTFHEMLDEALADSMAGGQGLGLAKIVEKDLERRPTTDVTKAISGLKDPR